MSLTYQVGNLQFPVDGDPEIDVTEQAMTRAVELSKENWNSTFAVWTGQMHGSELVALAYQGDLFRK